jgi:hypothetical protein
VDVQLFNDFFVVLLDSDVRRRPGEPRRQEPGVLRADARYEGSRRRQLGHGNTGLFTQCVNGATGCSGMPSNITTCTGTSLLMGTGFDDSNSGSCDSGSLEGGATGWLVTSGNVTPGEIITLRIAIWDTSDHSWDSLAVIDGFQWSTEVAQPGTVIFKESPGLPDRHTGGLTAALTK